MEPISSGASILLILLAIVFVVLCGYANTVDAIALFLHRHAEKIRRMHSKREEQMRTFWNAQWRRTRPAPPKGPVPIQKDHRREHHRGVAV